MPSEHELRDGDRRNVTVLFADMQDFTSLSERMDPEEMDSLMTRVFASFEAIVKRHGGTVEKYIGDALVAVFGVPKIHEDDATRAVNAGLDVLDEICRINESLLDSGLSIAFRVGINTGLITTGKRGEHDVVTGHAMSIASRLQAESRVNSILVSQTTRDHCEAEFTFSEPHTLHVKGNQESVTGFEVTGRNERPVDRDSPFIGRRDILDTVFRHFLRHEPGETGGAILVGDAGIGKSRLAAEVLRRCRQLPDFSSPVLYARAARYRTVPFAVVVDMLSGFFGLDEQGSRAEKEAAIAKQSTVEPRTASGFADLVEGNATSQDNEAFVLLYLVLKDVLKKHRSDPYPALAVVENLHFMDRQSRDFFRFYLKNADVKPYFLLTDRHPDPGIQEVFGGLETVEVPPLSTDESSELVRELCGPHPNQDTLASVLQNSRGNPLFIREYVRFAKENRDNSNLPTTIQNIFMTSIDPYDPQMRDLLKKLSVFAHSFDEADATHVHEVTDGDSRIVAPALSFFVRESILIEDDDLYMFKYDVFKEALYGSLLNYNKRILHGVIADRMVNNGDPHPMRLLLHLIRAELFDRASEFLWTITGLTGTMDYLDYVDVLLGQVDKKDVDKYLSLLFVKSAILFNNGQSDDADGLLKDIIDVAIREHSPMYAGSAYHLLTAHNMKSYSFEKARFCGLNALEHYRSTDTPPHRIQNLLEIVASSEMLRNREDEVARLVGEIEDGEQFGQFFESQAQLTVFKTEHLLMRGRYNEARSLLQPVAAQMDRKGENWLVAHLILGITNLHLCDWRELMRVDLAVLEGSSRHYSNISQINAHIAVAHHFLGDERASEQRLQQAEFTGSQVNNDFDKLDFYRTLAACSLIVGQADKAAAFARAGVGIGLRHSATYPVLTLLMVLVEIAANAGENDEARFFLTEAGLLLGREALFRNRDIALYHYYKGRLADGDDKRADAMQAARQAVDREVNAIEDPALVEAFFQVRSFGRIRRELNYDRSAASSAS